MTGTFQREPAFRTAFLVLAHAVFHGAGSGPDFRRGDVQDFFPNPAAICSAYWLLPLLMPPRTSVMRAVLASVFGDVAFMGFQHGLVGVQEVIQAEDFQRNKGEK